MIRHKNGKIDWFANFFCITELLVGGFAISYASYLIWNFILKG
jgi:hypothetical protein